MEQSPSSKANSSSASWKILHILWNPKIHYYIYNSLATVPVLSQMNTTCTFQFCFMIHFNIIHHSQLGLPCGLFSAGFLHPNLLIISLCPHICHMPHISSHPHQFNHLIHSFIILQLHGYLEKHFIGIYGQTKQLFPFQWLL